MYIVLLAVASGALEGYALRPSVDLRSISFGTEQAIDPKITVNVALSLAMRRV
jgi:hypothetical protein